MNSFKVGRLNEWIRLIVPAYAVILESYHVHRPGRQAITAVEYETWRSHAARDFLPVGIDYLFPFGEKDKGLRSGGSLYWVVHDTC